ncbi:3-hydroxyacyl-ACP dehydratase FabZ [Limnochorda pilosa]|uniref:3-hydroxyacyl-[acyl-carrier-protein] dehydratase FabZ n=1 Tax=Limnochorda pilosa TaxID=1555112 RepID=A0A0K2SIQ8_LIMPI|nr:3-hydroxyacyl-ACP dehydratase FabZ [Limnochorda pilosa]BAS26975.1 3-hydroxyacyl-ACP dehydratase [Limnochorda pilosa]
MFDAQWLLNVMPHRYPFLLVDRILEAEDGRAVGLKNVTLNEPFFQGHFPGQPIMPGVLIVEAMAQVASALLYRAPEYSRTTGLFAGIDQTRFRRPVVPGDQLRIETELLKKRGPIVRCRARAWVGDELAAEGVLTFAMSARRDGPASTPPQSVT